ncbi:MAG: mandelate racemase [Dorea sp.]|nr:mandelate racemase [Dorea sp.]
MKITGYELYEISIPTRRKHTWASSTVDVGQGYVILKILTDCGIEGFGEATAMPEWGGDYGRYYGESAGTTRIVIEQNLFPAIEGMDPFDIDRIHVKMDLAVRGYNYAKAAIDIAMYDIMGKAVEKPVYQLLGGRHREEIPIAHSLGVIMDIEAAVNEAVQAVAEGIKTIKTKGGLDLHRDLVLMKKLREELGPDIHILIDANQGYPSAKEAIKWGNLMNQYDLQYLEQPVEGLYPMKQVTHALECPVCADESCWTVADALDIIRENAADYISIYTTKPGGLYPARTIAKIAENAGIRCNVNGSGEFGVGNAANLHLASTGKNITLASVFPVTHIDGMEQTKVGGRWYMDDILKKPFTYHDGCLVVPDGAGLGIEVDMEKIKKYSVG